MDEVQFEMGVKYVADLLRRFHETDYAELPATRSLFEYMMTDVMNKPYSTCEMDAKELEYASGEHLKRAFEALNEAHEEMKAERRKLRLRRRGVRGGGPGQSIRKRRRVHSVRRGADNVPAVLDKVARKQKGIVNTKLMSLVVAELDPLFEKAEEGDGDIEDEGVTEMGVAEMDEAEQGMRNLSLNG